jgi:hypothetical protein
MFTAELFLNALDNYIEIKNNYLKAQTAELDIFYKRNIAFYESRLMKAKDQVGEALDGLINFHIEEKLKELGYQHAEF